MREPTPQKELFAFWARNLIAPGSTKITTEPQCGFYRRRLVKGGPWVPVAIWVHQETNEEGELTADETLMCLVDGKPEDADGVWSYCAQEPIPQDAYRHRRAYGEWAQQHKPEAPEVQPRQAVDLLTCEPTF